MSRLDELKKQYPELNVTVFDIMTRIDTSSSYKYIPLLCKLFAKKFNLIENSSGETGVIPELEINLINRGISTEKLTNNQLYALTHLCDNYYNVELFYTIKEFIYYMDKNQIENKDVTSYSNVEELSGAITLASIKELNKELQGHIIKEHEDETWLILRPLTFPASAKYGASTRWCTTYQKEKNYFEKYWRQGVLVYFINKKTGYKFAGYRDICNNDLSFWNTEDSKVDYLSLDVEDYLFTIVKRIFSSKESNKNLCTNEIQEQVHDECIYSYEIKKVYEDLIEQPTEVELNQLINEMNLEPVPTMRA